MDQSAKKAEIFNNPNHQLGVKVTYERMLGGEPSELFGLSISESDEFLLSGQADGVARVL